MSYDFRQLHSLNTFIHHQYILEQLAVVAFCCVVRGSTLPKHHYIHLPLNSTKGLLKRQVF